MTSWSRSFEEPIALPGGRKLGTLRQAAEHIQSLPAAEQSLHHWQVAVQHLIFAAERSEAWLMLARIAMLQAINHAMPDDRPPRRKIAKRYRIVT